MQDNKRAYISAKLLNVRLLNESADTDQPSSSETNVSLRMQDTSTIEARWETTPSDETMLVIVPNMDANLKEASTGKPLITYKSKHEVRFKVEAYTGFDPEATLPPEAIQPYFEMALWVVRARASAQIRSMGANNFAWPAIGPVMEAKPTQPETSPPAPERKKSRKPRGST